MRTFASQLALWLVVAAASGCVVTGASGRRIGVGPTLLNPSMFDRQGFSDPMASIVAPTENPLHPEAVSGRPRHGDARIEPAERTLVALVARYLLRIRPAIAIFGTL
jgi:hypothetical protein